MAETDRTPVEVYALYKNKETGQSIIFGQWVKTHYMPHANTEHHALEETEINGKAGLYMEFSDSTILIWDNGDYIIVIEANLDKKSTINLAKINKLKNFLIVMLPNRA